MTVASKKKDTQVWLITGSSRGLGRALAEAVLAAGHRLVATARNPKQLAELVERHGNRVRAVALDVTDERASIAAVQTAVDVFGRLDVLANNAGYGDLASIEDTSMKDFRAQIETNLFGVVHVTKAAIPVMRRQGSGHILQFSSVGGRVGPGRPRGLRRREVGRRGVLRGPREGGRSPWHQGDYHRARRLPHRLRRIVDDDCAGQPGVCRHGRSGGALPARVQRRATGGPVESGRGDHSRRGFGRAAAATPARQRRCACRRRR